MRDHKVKNYIKDVLENMPEDWLQLTTHRLDIYNEDLAKTQFLDQFEGLFIENNASTEALRNLPTAYDYIRLGHPLSCVLEWAIGKLNNLHPENIISFSSRTIPVLAVLRANLLAEKPTQILYANELPQFFDADIIRRVYGYEFELKKVTGLDEISGFAGSTIFISQLDQFGAIDLTSNIDFFVGSHAVFGSVLFVNGKQNDHYISDIQHVRRRETIAMTPANCLSALKQLIVNSTFEFKKTTVQTNKTLVSNVIRTITATDSKVLLASSGLSMQYAIMMGLIHDALENNKGKDIKFIVPPNCYGGTNDQARRVAACIDNVEIVDLLVDGDNDMVRSIDVILDEIAHRDAIPYIIAEIPTNPRVEVPDLKNLNAVLSKKRKTATGEMAVDPVFILDQTFCPNLQFLGEGKVL